MARTSGTREWADSNVNCVTGCSHDCRYCYAKRMAHRFGRVRAGDWSTMTVRQDAIDKNYQKRKGRVMFPTAHDITPAVAGPCLQVLGKLVAAGNEVLVTTKPHLMVIGAITSLFAAHKDQIQFRFTITSCDDRMLSAWEPGAPCYAERREALQLAWTRGWKTSVSIEPCLDRDPTTLIEQLRPYVTESIWLGVMNYQKGYHVTAGDVANWVRWFRRDPLVRFKDSIQVDLEAFPAKPRQTRLVPFTGEVVP